MTRRRRRGARAYLEAGRRAAIIFLAGATSAPISGALLDVSVWKATGVAGFAALWNYVGRVLQAARAAFDTPAPNDPRPAPQKET